MATDCTAWSPKESPFVVCSASQDQSGFQRRKEIVSSLKIPIEHAQTVSNTMNESSFIVSSTLLKTRLPEFLHFFFETNLSGMYQQLASNVFTPHVQLCESAVIGNEGDGNSYDGSRHMRRSR
jgi:hypothetical protein